MAHDHGNEYQVKIVHADGTEELSGWMNSEALVAQAMAAVHGPQSNAYWLRERNAVCANCLDREQKILEYPLADIPSQRCSPHDSRYLLAVGYKNRYDLPAESTGARANTERRAGVGDQTNPRRRITTQSRPPKAAGAT